MSKFLKSLFFLKLLFSFSNCFIPPEEKTLSLYSLSPYENSYKQLTIKIVSEYNKDKKFVGEKGVIFFVTDYNDTEENIFYKDNIEERTKFETILIDNLNKEYNVTCRLWKPTNDNIRIFCDLKEDLTNKATYINFNSASFIYRYEYNITIISEAENMSVELIKGNAPFLYSDTQEIYVQKEKDEYNLKFDIGKYNNEVLVLADLKNDFSKIIINNCQPKGKELTCLIKRTQIEDLLVYNDNEFRVSCLYDKYGELNLYNAFPIKINYHNVIKENITVEINKLKEKIFDINNFVTYETNVDSIDNLFTTNFSLKFENNENVECFFKKSENTNLLLLCKLLTPGNFVLEQTKGQIKLDNIHYKYNFVIEPINNTELVTITSDISNHFLNTILKF